jgi:hypothetical protein
MFGFIKEKFWTFSKLDEFVSKLHSEGSAHVCWDKKVFIALKCLWKNNKKSPFLNQLRCSRPAIGWLWLSSLYCNFATVLSPNFLTFKERKNRFQGINSASVCSLAGRYDNPVLSLFLAPIGCLKIPSPGFISWRKKTQIPVRRFP